jgi:hypothetical protein
LREILKLSENKNKGDCIKLTISDELEVCDRCISVLERLVEAQEKKNRAKVARLMAAYKDRSGAAKKAWDTKRKNAKIKNTPITLA